MNPQYQNATLQPPPLRQKPDPEAGAVTDSVMIAGKERILSGSQAKTAYALRMNAEQMCREAGINAIGFLTLTVGEMDEKTGKFRQVWDAQEASDRVNNLKRHLLPEIFEKGIIVSERHKNGAIHFHILGIVRDRIDIRSGFDFEAFSKAVTARNHHTVDHAAESRYKRAASEELREIWATLRRRLPKLGFGRAELTPVRKTGEAVSSYVSKYIEKNVCQRRKDDKHKKLVRYFGWGKAFKCSDHEAIVGIKVDGKPARPVGTQLKASEFGWGSRLAVAWHCKARELGRLLGANTSEEIAEALGPRWAWHISTIIPHFPGRETPTMIWGYNERELCRRELGRLNVTFVRRHYDGLLGPERFQAWLKAAQKMEREFERWWHDPDYQLRQNFPKVLIINDEDRANAIDELAELQQSIERELLQSAEESLSE